MRRVREAAEKRPAVGEGSRTCGTTGMELGWTYLAGKGGVSGTQSHGRSFRLRLRGRFSFSLCFSDKLLNDGDGLLEIEADSRGRRGLSECGVDLRRLSDRGLKGEAVSTVVVGCEWLLPMISTVGCTTGRFKHDGYLYGGERRWQNPVARSNAFLL